MNKKNTKQKKAKRKLHCTKKLLWIKTGTKQISNRISSKKLKCFQRCRSLRMSLPGWFCECFFPIVFCIQKCRTKEITFTDRSNLCGCCERIYEYVHFVWCEITTPFAQNCCHMLYVYMFFLSLNLIVPLLHLCRSSFSCQLRRFHSSELYAQFISHAVVTNLSLSHPSEIFIYLRIAFCCVLCLCTLNIHPSLCLSFWPFMAILLTQQ